MAIIGGTEVLKSGPTVGRNDLERGIVLPENMSSRPWTDLSLLNSWAGISGTGTTYPTPGYVVDHGGFVHLRGMLEGGTNGSVAFVMPFGVRPAFQFVHLNASYWTGAAFGVSIVRAQSNGNVDINFTGTLVWMSLDGLVYSIKS